MIPEQTDPRMAEGLSTMERPIPGESLTHDPEQPRAFEQAPKFTKLNEAQEEIFMKLTSEEAFMPIMQLIDSGEATIMDVTQNLLYAGFSAGQWNPDLMLLLAEPTAYTIMALAERAGIEYEIDNEPEDKDPSDKLAQTMSKKAPESKKVDKTAIAPEVVKKLEEVPESLLQMPKGADARIDTDAVDKEEAPSLMEKPTDG